MENVSGNAYDDFKLSTSYIFEGTGAKLSKQKLQINSAVLLPLRRLMLLGTEDGFIRAVA